MQINSQSHKDIDPDLQMVYDYFEQKKQSQGNIEHIHSAAIKFYKMSYHKFINFQKFHVFQVSQNQPINVQPLTIQQMRKLIRLIGNIHAKHISSTLSKQDVKGIWSIISFIFPSRTGLFLNQFFSMIVSQKLPLDMYPKFDNKRQATILLSNVKEQLWFSDKEFISNIQTLIKQAKTSDPQEHDKLTFEYNQVIKTLQQNDEYNKSMSELFTAMNSFGVFFEISYVEAKRIQWQNMINDQLIEPDYVLSQPDTLVADICQEFEEQEYRYINRKLSDRQEDFQDQTQTNIRTASLKKINQKDHQQDQTMKFKRRINFDSKPQPQNTVNMFAFDEKQSDEQTKPFRRLRKQRPTHKQYLKKMMSNYRRIDDQIIKRAQRKRNTKSKAENLRRENIFIQKQIKKHTFIDTSLLVNRRQKRNIQGQNQSKNHKSTNQLQHEKQQSLNWNQRFIQDDSENVPISVSNHYDNEEYSNRSASQKSKRKRTSIKKNGQNKNQRKQNKSPRATKQSKPQKKDYGKRFIHTSNLYIQSSQEQFYLQNQHQNKVANRTSKYNRNSQPKKTKSIQKRQKRNHFEVQNNQKKEQRKERQFKRLKKQGQTSEANESSNHLMELQSDEQDISVGQQFRNNNQRNINEPDEKQNQAVLAFPQTNKKKYSHLLYNAELEKQKKTLKSHQQINLDNFIINKKNDTKMVNFEPLERLMIRKLTLLQFEQTQKAQQRVMFIEGDQGNPYQKMRKQVNEYQLIESQKMEFTLQEYINYIESFENKEELSKQIKKLANEYLSKTFQNKIPNQFKRNADKFFDQSKSIKLILIARKILAMYILAKKQTQLPNSQNSHKIFSQFSLTYIKPLFNHYIYKILTEIYAQIINALFTSQGDQDFQLLNNASLPFLILLHDIKQLYNDRTLKCLPNFCKSFFEDIYQIVDQQSTIIMIDLIKSINLNSQFSKKVEQMVQSLLKQQFEQSNIHLPRATKNWLQKNLRVQLHPLSLMYSSLVAYNNFQISLYEKIGFIFKTMQSNISMNRINELRASRIIEKNEKGDKGYITYIYELIIEGIQSLKNQDKGIGEVLNLVYTVDMMFERMDFMMQSPNSKFSFESKIIVLLIKVLKKLCTSGPSIPIIGQNNRNSLQNENKQKTLLTIKQFLKRSLIAYISEQSKKQANFLKLINIITLQQLKQLVLQDKLIQQSYINVDINLQMISVFMMFNQFRQSSVLNRPQVIKIIDKIMNAISQKIKFVFGGKNRSPELIEKMFDLLIIGYKCQIFDKGNHWKVNDQVLPQLKHLNDGSLVNQNQSNRNNQTYLDYKTFLNKNDLVDQYWQKIKQIIKVVLDKYKENITQLSQMNSVHQLQIQKIKNYSNLLSHMLNRVISNFPSSKFLDIQYFYKNCTQDNCLTYSVRHVLINLVSFFTELDYFIQLNIEHYPTNIDVQSLFYPGKLVQNLVKIIFIDKQKQYEQKLYDDEDDKDEDMILLKFTREEKKSSLIYKWILIVNSKLNYQQLQQKIKTSNSNQSPTIWAIISVIQFFKRLLIANNLTQNSYNQTQRAILIKLPFMYQYIKKLDYLSFFAQPSTGINTQREIKDNEVQDLEGIFQFTSAFARLLLPLLEAKQCPQLTRLTDQFVKNMVHESNVHKIHLLNIMVSVILKKLVSSIAANENNQHQIIRKDNNASILTKKRHEIDDFLVIMQLWCKIYEKIHTVNLTSSSAYNLSDLNSLLYLVFKSIGEKKRRNQKQLYLHPMIYCVLDTCLEVFKTSYWKNNSQSKANSLMKSLFDMLYKYLRQLFSYAQSLQQKKQGNRPMENFRPQLTKPEICQHTLSINYVKIFNSLIQWPVLMNQGVRQTKLQYEILISKDPNQVFTKSKSLVQNLIEIKINELSELTFSKESSQTNISSSTLKLHQSIKLLQDCMVGLNKLENNVYKIKDNLPQWIFIYLMKKIVESQLQLNGSSNLMNRAPYMNQIGNSNLKQLKPITLLFKIIDHLSLLNSSHLLQKIIHSCIKFLSYEKANDRHKFMANHIENLQKIDFQQIQLKVHLMGKEKIPEYRKRLFLTLLMIVKYSTKPSQTIEKMLWSGSSSIEKFINMVNQEKESWNVQISRRLANQGNKLNNNKENQCSIPQSYEEMICKWLIRNNSDFSLIKTMIDQRLKPILHSSKSSAIKSQQRNRLAFLLQAIEKSVKITQNLNRSCKLGQDETHKCDEYLQIWFKNKVCTVQTLLNSDKQQGRNKSVESNQGLQSLNSLNSIQEHIHLDNYLIHDPIKKESTKMEIEQ